MTQTVLRDKFVQFVKLINPSEAKKIEKDVGFCFGLSICHAAMKQIGKLAWWEEALIQIVHWDGKKEGLDKKIHLPGAKKPQTLREILTRVLNYVKYHQEGINHPASEQLFDHQRGVLAPETHYFEILTPQNKILTIKKREIVSGAFMPEELIFLLNKEDIEKRICILSSMEHAITVEYQHPHWFLYDPNYDHVISPGKSICKVFSSKKDLIEEVTDILGDMISIELASFDNKSAKLKKVFESHIQNNPEIIVCALPMMATDGPQYITAALKNADKMYGKQVVENLLANMLMSTFHTEDNWNGLHFISRYSPKHLTPILKYGLGAKDGKEKVLYALHQKTSNGTTGIEMIKQYAPECMVLINPLLKMKSLLKNSLFMKKAQNKTPLLNPINFLETEKKMMR